MKNKKIYVIKRAQTLPRNIDCGIESMNFYSKRGIKLHYFCILLESNAVDIAKVRKRSLLVQPGAPSEPERQEYQITST